MNYCSIMRCVPVDSLSPIAVRMCWSPRQARNLQIERAAAVRMKAERIFQPEEEPFAIMPLRNCEIQTVFIDEF